MTVTIRKEIELHKGEQPTAEVEAPIGLTDIWATYRHHRV